MKYGITLIPYGNLTTVIPQVIPYLRKSELVSHGRSSIDDIVKYLYTGQMFLWAIYEEDSNKLAAFLITEVKQYPQKKMLVWQYLAGDTHIADDAYEVVNSTVEKAAKDLKCDGMEAVGRHGWKPLATKLGYSSFAVLYEKFFD